MWILRALSRFNLAQEAVVLSLSPKHRAYLYAHICSEMAASDGFNTSDAIVSKYHARQIFLRARFYVVL